MRHDSGDEAVDDMFDYIANSGLKHCKLDAEKLRLKYKVARHKELAKIPPFVGDLIRYTHTNYPEFNIYDFFKLISQQETLRDEQDDIIEWINEANHADNLAKAWLMGRWIETEEDK